ncbi:hypothetical protein ONZ43_g19 [Nemania bipapillata]|uniref:Uncharacterized protein n=1 Tax=Nemania bipapillata TaxID=110536 RepID=A0ACC2J9Z7_9PEZI|nr:hypothetical protein ONZ43_g19 [Nemania bipapillata]
MEVLESEFGSFHPETLRAQLWCVTVDLVLYPDEGGKWDELKQEIIEKLSKPWIMKQRLVECFDMKRHLVSILIGPGKCREVKGLVDNTISELEKAEVAEGNEWLREPLSDLRTEFLKLKQKIGDSLRENKAGTEVSENKGTTK